MGLGSALEHRNRAQEACRELVCGTVVTVVCRSKFKLQRRFMPRVMPRPTTVNMDGKFEPPHRSVLQRAPLGFVPTKVRYLLYVKWVTAIGSRK